MGIPLVPCLSERGDAKSAHTKLKLLGRGHATRRLRHRRRGWCRFRGHATRSFRLIWRARVIRRRLLVIRAAPIGSSVVGTNLPGLLSGKLYQVRLDANVGSNVALHTSRIQQVVHDSCVLLVHEPILPMSIFAWIRVCDLFLDAG